MERLSVGARVRLKCFHGAASAPPDIVHGDNYWLLIGTTGFVVGDEISGGHEKGRRVLVQFDQSVRDLGLHCHNKTPNALYIFVDDLDIAD